MDMFLLVLYAGVGLGVFRQVEGELLVVVRRASQSTRRSRFFFLNDQNKEKENKLLKTFSLQSNFSIWHFIILKSQFGSRSSEDLNMITSVEANY